MTIPLGNSLRMQWNLQVQSLMFLSWVFLSTEKAYSSFPRLKNLELILFINTLLLHGLNPRPSLYNISAKNHLNCLQNLLFESLFLWVFVAIFGCGNIFDQRLLFDHKQLCIWPLELSEHYEPRNQSKNQRLKPLRNRLTVSRAKFDVRDFWRCIAKFYHKSVAIWCTVYVCELYLNKTFGYTALMGVPPRYRPMFIISST